MLKFLTAIFLSALSVLVYADSPDPLSSTVSSLPNTYETTTGETPTNKTSPPSFFHAMEWLESEGVFDEPKTPAPPPPAGVFGAYVIPQGKFIFNYRPLWQHYQGMQIGTSATNSTQVASTVPAYNTPGENMRLIPTQYEAASHLFSAAYGITNYLNFILVANYSTKNVSYVTYAGATSTTLVGAASAQINGAGDTYASLLVKLYQGNGQELLMGLGLSLPSGSINRMAYALTPQGTMANVRVPYGFQLGDGTYDAIPTLAYTGSQNDFSWGMAVRARLPMQSYNGKGWRVGNQFEGTGWVGYKLSPYFSATLRFSGVTQDSIHGVDPLIPPIATSSDPNFAGGQRVMGLIGVSGGMPISQIGGGARISVEAGTPLYQNLNGVQLTQTWSLQLSAGIYF